jgi:tetratricopeptide (TPR) repeat protein
MRRLVALLACAAACTGDSSAPHLARGNVLVNNGKREEAAAEYRQAARLAPKSPLPLERLGDVLYDLGKKDEALAAYREAATRDPGAFTARIGAARVLTDQGKLADAREELTTALRGQPANLYLLLSRGNLNQRAGDAKAALRDYETAVHLESRNVPALFHYGAALLQDGQVEEAGRTFDRLVEVAPDAPEGWFGRALWLARRGDRPRAAEALASANVRLEKAARGRLAEQGVKGEALDKATTEAIHRSREQMEADPAFAPFAADPAFRRAAGFAARPDDATR